MMQGSYRSAPGPPMMDHGLAPLPIAGDNPYRAPGRAVSGRPAAERAHEVLAGRGSRLAAVIIDYLAMIAAAIPGMLALFYVDTAGQAETAALVGSGTFVLGLGAFATLQASYIVRDGQTLGKKLMRIRIVDHIDGQVPPWTRVLGMRYLVNTALRQVPLYFLIDAVFIFGEEQRCIHDHLAGTKVIEA